MLKWYPLGFFAKYKDVTLFHKQLVWELEAPTLVLEVHQLSQYWLDIWPSFHKPTFCFTSHNSSHFVSQAITVLFACYEPTTLVVRLVSYIGILSSHLITMTRKLLLLPYSWENKCKYVHIWEWISYTFPLEHFQNVCQSDHQQWAVYMVWLYRLLIAS